MKLRSQMLLAGALTLAVPAVGWQSVKQLYAALLQTRIDEQTLKVANMRLALSEALDVSRALETGQANASQTDWYAESAKFPLFIDGYADDWQTLTNTSVRYTGGESSSDHHNGDLTVSLRASRRNDRFYLFVSVTDDVVIYHQPPVLQADAGEDELPDSQTRLVNGDAIELLVQTGDERWQHGLFRAIAPGPVRAVTASEHKTEQGHIAPAGKQIEQWQAAWVKESGGYQVEINVPLPPMGSAIGLSVVDVDRQAAPRTHWAGNISPEMMDIAHRTGKLDDTTHMELLFYESEAVKRRLQAWITPGVRARLFDVHGRLLADINNLNTVNEFQDQADAQASSGQGILDALLLRVFSFFVAGDLPLMPEPRQQFPTFTLNEQRRATVMDDSPATSRYVTDDNDRVLGTLAPIGIERRRGYLLIEANEEHSSAYAGSQLARLFSLLLMVSLLAGSGLLIFATVLSVRIRRLSREAQFAIAADGRVRGLPGSDAQDEIGDLSRKLSSLLSRSAAYTQYLEALSSRLSHELRTPLSVVRTSIENLDRNRLDDQSRMLIDRASGGTEQLGTIIQALLESTRLEQTVQLAQMQPVILSDWLDGSLLRYQQVYPNCNFRIHRRESMHMTVNASPELLQQAFDKLVDNSVSFSLDGQIVLHMAIEKRSEIGKSDTNRVVLSVANNGPQINESSLPQVFDPMFSLRQHSSEDLHLGLGLYIVKMIAEAHGGEVFARNQPPMVVIGMMLPIRA